MLTDLDWIRAKLKTGNADDLAAADAMYTTIVRRSAVDHHLVPEMYVSEQDDDFPGNTGDPTGAIPMVGFGAGAFIITSLERAAH